MNKNQENIRYAASVFPVKDIEATAIYYRDQLGFEIAFKIGEPVNYAVLKKEKNLQIHLTLKRDQLPPSKEHTNIYVFVKDVDILYEEFKNKNVEINKPIANREYGYRDFDIKDCNGFILSFGARIGYI